MSDIEKEKRPRKLSKQSAWTQEKEDDGIQLLSLSPVENIKSGEEDEIALTSLKSLEPVHQPTSRRYRRKTVINAQISAPEDDSITEEHPSARPVSRVSWRDLDEEIQPSPVHSSEGHSGNATPPTETSQSRDEVSYSSRHYATEVLSGEGSRSQTPLSETRSYRDRLRDRFQAVKERAGMSSRSRLREQRLHTPLSSRMDELLRKEEDDVEAALSKHEKLRVKWKDVAGKAVSQDLKEDEDYDFFTCTWDDAEDDKRHEKQVTEGGKHAEEQIIHSTPSSPRSPEVEEEEVTGERVKLLAADLLGLRDEWELFEIVPPDCTNWDDLHSRENRLLFFPNKSPVPLEDKLRPGCEVRYPEDEGLYVGSQPLVSYGNKNKMEHRLLAEGNMEWFGDDGEIVTLPDPRTKALCLSPLHVVDSKFPELTYQAAVVTNVKRQLITELRPNANYILEVEVCSIIFTHHPFFSSEHVLAQKLIEKYNFYTKCISQDIEHRLLGKLTALRTARDNLCTVIEHSNESQKDQIERLQKYKEEIKETKKMILYESRSQRQLLCDVLSLWRDLKRLRNLQGYSSTSLRLLIQKEPEADPDREHDAWNEMIQLELDELETELQDEYNEKFEQYQRQLAKWKKKQKTKKSRKQSHQADIDSIEEEDDIYKIEEMEDSITEMEEKPRPPDKVNSDDLRSELIKTLTDSLRPPGEPELHIELIHNAPFEQNPLLNKEKLRRMAVQRSEIFIKIFYNKKEVCKSQYRPLGHKFIVSIAQVFPICIVQWPEELKIEIHESGGLLCQHLISEIFIPIPSSQITRHNSETTKYEFSSDQVISVNHSGVGSGVYFNLLPDGDNSKSECIFTSGYVSCKIGWATDAGGKILAPPEKYLSQLDNETSEMPDIDALIDVEKLKTWTEKIHLDPNNPTNAPIFHYIQNASTSLYTEPDYFRLDPLQQEFDFCTMEDLDNNARLKLLHLRDQGEPEFRGLCMVPLREKEIPNDIFKAYEKRISSSGLLPDTVLASDPLDSYRAWGQHFLQDVRQKILKQCRLAQQQRHLHDIITEEQVPDIGTLGLTFLKWLKPKRPLRPVRKERKKITVQNLGGQEVKIIVNIANAFNVPIRKDLDTVSTIVGPQGYKFAVVPVKPFVEVSFRDVVVRTTASEGSNPTWNQELQISLQPPNKDFSPGMLQQLHDMLYIHLFDEIVVDILEDDRARGTVIHNRLERHWLGSLHIPFSTLYFNSRIEGTFQLYSPPVLLGYEREPQHRHFGSFEQQGNGQRSATYLTVFITIQPALTPPEPFKERLESSEPEYIEQHLNNWEQEVIKIVPNRRVKTLVLDISGKSVCVTRFLRPLAPPVIAENQDTTDKMVARFVSMIPVVPGSVLFPGLFDIWLTSEQVLRLLTGDSEDLALILCCYFLHMGKKAWVLLGSGIPHGPTAYVLTYEEEQHNVYTYYLWDPVTGYKYEIWDSFCPLQSVYCLINDVNIWANIQSEELPRRTRYDVKRRSDWFPAFNRTLSILPGSVQPPALEYILTSSNACQFLRDKIEKSMRDNLMKWRRTTRTLWNRYCIAILRKLLPTLEYSCWGIENSAGQHHIQELHVLGSHKMCGFPINMPYTNMEAITEAMKATGVHLNEDPNVEFALAVYVHPYPNNILSIWIYVASLVRRR